MLRRLFRGIRSCISRSGRMLLPRRSTRRRSSASSAASTGFPAARPGRSRSPMGTRRRGRSSSRTSASAGRRRVGHGEPSHRPPASPETDAALAHGVRRGVPGVPSHEPSARRNPRGAGSRLARRPEKRPEAAHRRSDRPARGRRQPDSDLVLSTATSATTRSSLSARRRFVCCIGALGLEPKAVEGGPDAARGDSGAISRRRVSGGQRHGLPVAQVSAESWSCQSLLDLGDWALAALGDGDADGSVLASDTVNSLKRAWRSGDTVFVRWTGDGEPPASRPAEKFDLERRTLITR